MYGEKEEQMEELRLDLQDVKDMYKMQLDEILMLKRQAAERNNKWDLKNKWAKVLSAVLLRRRDKCWSILESRVIVYCEYCFKKI